MSVVKFVAHFEFLFGPVGRLDFSLLIPLFWFLYDVIVSESIPLVGGIMHITAEYSSEM